MKEALTASGQTKEKNSRSFVERITSPRPIEHSLQKNHQIETAAAVISLALRVNCHHHTGMHITTCISFLFAQVEF